ncbi:MAG: iron complex outermembrane receptor protein [Halieaceae bacterium]|jgi:iron complex outermembrane receptor protein
MPNPPFTPKSTTALSAAISSMVIAVMAAPTLAQPMIEEVIVTAQKRSESVQQIPLAVTALSSGMLDERGITDISSMTASVPGMHFGQSGNNVRITIRGIGTEQTTVTGDPGVAFHIDGVYQARSSAGNALFYDLARIEVLRGPQGTLYGRNATGGSINLISNAPDEELGGELEGQIGNYGQQRLRGVLNTPLIDNKLLLRVSGQYENRDGFYENQTPGADDLTDMDSLNLRGQLLYMASDTFDALLSVNYGSDGGAGWGAKAIGAYPAPPPFFINPKLAKATPNPDDPWKIRTNGLADRDNSRQGATVILNWDLGAVALKSITAWQDNEVDTFRDLDFSDADILNENSSQDSRQYSQEIQLSSTGAEALEWVIGLYWLNEETDADYWLSDKGEGLSTFPFFPGIDVGLAEPAYFGNASTTETDSVGAFGQASYQISDAFKLTAGLRYSKDEKKSDIFRKGFTAPAGSNFIKEDDWSSVTWKLGADWFITEDSMLYASVSTGFKSGGFLQIEAADPYDEEEIIAWELGAKNRFFNNQLQANISAYFYEYTDMQLRTIRDLASIVSNAGEAEMKGVELELTARPSDALQLTANFAFTNAEFTDYFNDDPQVPGRELLDLSGNDLPRSPDTTVYLSAAYSWDLAAGSVTASANYYWSDEVYFSPFNRKDEDYQGSYHRTGARLVFNSASDAWYVAAAASDIEDNEVASQISLGDATLGGADTAQWQAPRTYTLTAGYRFQ